MNVPDILVCIELILINFSRILCV